MAILTARGAFAESYMRQFDVDIASIRELSEKAFLQKIESSDVIIHNAATIAPSNLHVALINNFDSTRFLVKHLEVKNARSHLILLSSMSILSPRDENIYSEVLGMTSYEYSKYLAETFSLKSLLDNVSCVRFSTIFYMNHNKDGLSKLVYDAVTTGKITLYNNGAARRNFIPIDIAANYVNKIARLNPNGKTTYNIVGSSSVSFRWVADVLKKHLPGLIINNQNTYNSPSVLYDFSSSDINSLGIVHFELEEYIIKYLESLKK